MAPKIKPFNITDIFKDYQFDVIPKNDGNFKTTCCSHGLQGGREPGFIIFTDSGKNSTGRSYCSESLRSFDILETYALLNGFIDCNDGNLKEEFKTPLTGDIRKQVIDHFKNSYGEEIFEEIAELLGFRKEIELPDNGKLISTFASELGNEMGNKEVIFLRPQLDGVYETAKVRHVDGTIETDGLKEVRSGRFITMTENYFRPYANIPKKDGSGSTITIRSMQGRHSSTVLESDQFRNKLLVLDRILQIPLPIIHKGKIEFPCKGYDKRFGTYLAQKAPSISHPKMTLEDAKELLEDLFHEFCFKTDADKDRALAAFLTPFIKGLLPKFCTRCPIFVYVANRERSGKDYCAGVTGMAFEGFVLEDAPISDGEKHRSGKNDELSKKIMSVLKTGRRRYHSANNKGMVDSAVLEGATTSERMSNRELGTNNMFEIDNEIDFSLSGNQGIDFTPDLMNRSVFINLFLDLQDANAREFERPNLHGWVLENRELILSALFAFVKNWFDKGRPKGSVPFASFPMWADVCGGIMEAAGYSSPCIRDEDHMVTDKTTDENIVFFEHFYEKFPDKNILFDDILREIYDAQEEGLEMFSYLDFEEKTNKKGQQKIHGDTKNFGKILNKVRGRIFSDIKLLDDNNKKGERRKYRFTKKFESKIKVKSGAFGAFGASVGSERIALLRDSTALTGPHITPKAPLDTPPAESKPLKTSSTEALNAELSLGLSDPKSDKKVKETDKPPKSGAQKPKTVIKSTESIKPIRKNGEIQKPDVGTDREVQFYEDSWDTRNIKQECTIEDVEIFIKNNQGVETVKMMTDLGVGSLKHLNDLKASKKVREEDYKLWI